MPNYVQIIIVLILISLASVYRVLIAHGEAGDKTLTQRLKYIIGLSSVWTIFALVVSYENRIKPSNYWVFATANKAFYILALLFALSSYYFIKVFPTRKSFGKKYKLIEKIAVVGCLAIVPCVVFSNLLTGSYGLIGSSPSTDFVKINHSYNYFNGQLSFLYAAVIVILLLVTIYISVSKRYNSKATEQERSQARIIVFGITMAILLGVTFQLALPRIFKDYPNQFYTLGQLAPLFIVFSSYYALLKYKLFDIKTSAFRAVGYSFSIATLVGIYSILVYGVVMPLISPGEKFSVSILFLIAGGTSGTIYFYDKVKFLFDLITEKLFFKSSYNLTKFLDDLNQTLINSGGVEELTRGVAQVMTSTLKSDFLVISVHDGEFEITIDSRLEGMGKEEADTETSLLMTEYHFKESQRVVLRDYLDRKKYPELYAKLVEKDTPVAIDLGEPSKANSSLKKALESADRKLLFLGPKKSGESYSAQDFDALRIVSKELVVALQNSMRFEEIKLFNIDLQRKVDNATIKLKEQNTKLVAADELKDDFLSIASHQMRTPISAILGYASILSSGDAGKLNKEQEKFAKIVESSTKRLSYLINDFLTVSRLKSGKFNIEKVDADLKNTIKGEVKNLENQFKAKDIKLKMNIDGHIPIMKADEQKIRQVMMNLIDNALYYTPSGGQVEVTLKREGKGVVFEVKDNGIGVPKADQAMLFSKMFRASNAQRMRPDGTGLGLYLAKKVVLGHHGHIIFRSTQGEGSTFGFNIPIK